MSEHLEVADADGTRALGRRIGAVLRCGDLVVLTGPLGAGKTTLAGGIGDVLGVRGPITSPTFVLARTHPSLHGGPPLLHVDAYRLGGPSELDDLDLDLERSVTVVEWGAGLVAGLADSVLEVLLERRRGAGPASAEDPFPADEPRSIVVRGTGPRWAGTPWADAAGS